MPFDYKKEERYLYRPSKKVTEIEVPVLSYVAVRGEGDPNEEDGEYKRAVGKLYALEYTIKMSKMGEKKIDSYFDYIVPPLEGLWWTDSGKIDYSKKDDYKWIAMIRLPEFVTPKVFEWAVKSVEEKKDLDMSDVEYFEYDEGKCLQCMHLGPYDNENETIEKLENYRKKSGFESGIDNINRFHHEIYLSDPRRSKPENLKTLIRIPISN